MCAGGDLVGVGRLEGRRQHPEPGGWVGDEQVLEVPGVEAVDGVDRVDDGVLRRQLEHDGHVAELEVAVDQGDGLVGAHGEGDGEVGGDDGLARPTLGGEDGDHLTALALLALLVAVPAGRPGRWSRPTRRPGGRPPAAGRCRPGRPGRPSRRSGWPSGRARSSGRRPPAPRPPRDGAGAPPPGWRGCPGRRTTDRRRRPSASRPGGRRSPRRARSRRPPSPAASTAGPGRRARTRPPRCGSAEGTWGLTSSPG